MITTSPLEIHVCICVSVIKMPVTLCPFHCITRFRIIIPYCMFCYTCTVLIVLCEIGNKFWFDRHPQLSKVALAFLKESHIRFFGQDSQRLVDLHLVF